MAARPRGAPPTTVDVGAQLAARLPTGADACVVGRPSLLSAARRSLFAQASQGDPLAWLPRAPVVAFAMARHEQPGSHPTTVLLVRTSTDAPTVRDWFLRNAQLRFAFGTVDDDDPPDVRVSIDDERTLRVTSGRWPRRSDPGTERRCLDLALRSPDALEVSSKRGLVVRMGGYPNVARARDVVATDDGTSVRLIRRTLTDAAATEGLPFGDLDVDDLLRPSVAQFASRWLVQVTHDAHDGPLRVTEMRISWEDLALLRQDVSVITAAEVAGAQRTEPHDVTAVDVTNLAVVERERLLWAARMDESVSGDARAHAAEQLRALLERAIPEHPAQTDLRRALFEVLSRELEQPRAAIAVAEAALTDLGALGDAESWRQLRREGFARLAASELAPVLVEDGIVDASASQRAAVALERLVADGTDYAFAEGSWIAADALLRRVQSQRSHIQRMPPTTLPLAALPEAISALLESRGVQGALYVAVAGHVRPWGLVQWDAEQSPVVDLELGDDTYLVGVASVGATDRLRALGVTLSDHVAGGAAGVSFFVVPLGGSAGQAVSWGHLDGQIEDDRLHVERALGPAARVDWDRVRRYLADPLASAAERVFPPPEVRIDAASTRDVNALLSAADAEHGLSCERRDELGISCAAASDEPDSLRRALVVFATARLGQEAQRLLGR